MRHNVIRMPQAAGGPKPSSYQQTTDEELMLAYKLGDTRAFEALLGRHQKGIYNFLYRLLGQAENVEEAFQEVFIRVVRSADSYTPSAKFSTWIYTIARNFCIDRSRKVKPKDEVSLDGSSLHDEEDFSLKEKVSDGRPLPDEEATTRRLVKHLERGLASLNPDQREVFLMREKLGLPFEEIAEVVGSSVPTVKSRMRYALAFLQEFLKKEGILDL